MDGDEIDLITKVKDAPQRSGSDAYLVIVTAAERDVIVRALRERSAREYGSEAVTT